MGVKPGYKQTEVGVIPEDWDIKKIGDKIDLLTGFPFPSNKYTSSGIKLLRGSNIKRGKTDWADDITQYWKKVTFDLQQYVLNEGDIVIAMDGSLVGRSFARLSKNDLPALLLQRVARIRSKKIDRGYLKEWICGDKFTKHCDSVKTVTAIPHISPEDIRSFAIPIPPTLTEQTTIATALSDADALIQSLERLIAKKHDIKQGAMQELLTGKKRLPGFEKKKGYKQTDVGVIPEDWDVRILGDTFSIRAGGDLIKDAYQKEYDEKYPFPIYSNALSAKGLYGYSRIYRHEDNCITVTARGTIGFANMRNHKFDAIGRLLILQPMLRVDCFYISEFINQRISFSIESTGVPQLTAPQIAKDKIAFPEYEEQTAIATVLSDMDAEIGALESKLAKARQIKQGMMQELLTGRIRLT